MADARATCQDRETSLHPSNRGTTSTLNTVSKRTPSSPPADSPIVEHKDSENIPVSAALMVLGTAFFVTLASLVKLASDEATPMQAVLYRSLFSALPLMVFMRFQGVAILGTNRKLLIVRGTLGFMALFCYLWAITHIHLADVLALQQMNPIFVAFLSVWLLGERPRKAHYLLALMCMVGALLVVRPTRGLASLESAVALLSAVFSSGAYVAVRALTKTETTPRIVLWFALVATLLSLPFVIPGWQPLSLRAHLLLISAGPVAIAAQTLMTAAYRRAPAHLASAFSYASVPLAYLAGLLFWDERPDWLSNIGIALIVVGGMAIVVWMRPKRSRL
jgi:drug/metabolite transporter (DMT)-like permease